MSQSYNYATSMHDLSDKIAENGLVLRFFTLEQAWDIYTLVKHSLSGSNEKIPANEDNLLMLTKLASVSIADTFGISPERTMKMFNQEGIEVTLNELTDLWILLECAK